MAESDDTKKDGKKFDFKKYRWWMAGAGGLVVLLFLAMRRQSSAGTAAQTTAQNSGIDPATGYLYGSSADLAALNGSTEGVYSAGAGTQGLGGNTTNNYYYSGSGTNTTGTTGTTGTGGAGPVLSGGAPPHNPYAYPAQPSSSSTSYTVQPSDTLSSISAKFYGNAGHVRDIANANRGRIAGGTVQTGQRIVVPSLK